MTLTYYASSVDNNRPLWEPSADRIVSARLTHFTRWLQSKKTLHFHDYESLWRWSVEDQDVFWAAIWEYAEVISHKPYLSVMNNAPMPHSVWFEGCELNFVDQVFRHRHLRGPAIVGTRFSSRSGVLAGQAASAA